MGRKKVGPLHDMTKAQAGKRAAIEKLIEAERKKKEPPKPVVVKPAIRFGPRPIVRLPGQPMTTASNRQATCGSKHMNGRPTVRGKGHRVHSKKCGPIYENAGISIWQKTSCPPVQFIPRPINYPVFPPLQPIDRRQVSVNLPPPAPASDRVQTISFLALPGELRNKIYAYAFVEEFYVLKWIPKTPRKYLTYYLPKRNGRARAGPELGATAGYNRRLLDYPRRIRSTEMMVPYHLSPGPAAILLTCKRVNEEATGLFYASSTFGFSVPGTLKAFLAAIRPKTAAAIQSLALKHYTAGNPEYTDFCTWKIKDDHGWDDLMWQAQEVLTGIKRLSLDLIINDIPVLFGRNADWKLPYYAWEEMGITECKVKLKNSMTPNTVLEVEAYILQKTILGKEFRDEEEDEKEKALGKRRRIRILNLVDDGW